MKRFETDRSGYGQFEFAATTTEGHAALTLVDRFASSSVHRSAVWNSAVARRAEKRGLYCRFFKPLMDNFLILLSLPFTLPLIALCALALWIEGGTPFYTQPRLGRNGKRFAILKLRTMVSNADAVLEDHLAADPERRREWDELQKLKDDPRITRIGQFLRASSLDELPQLFNVLMGQMSLVGPRPMMPEQLPLYGEPSAYFALRPGITGLWQVSARNSTRFSYRNEADWEYKQKISFRFDTKVLFKTVGVVLCRTGC